jgi:hypothetical protein
LVEFEEMIKKATEEIVQKKYAFFIGSGYHNHLNVTLGKSLPRMKNERFELQHAFIMPKNNMLESHIDDILKRFIETGIEKYNMDYGSWLETKPFVEEIIDKRKILALSDLEYGFVLWLGCCFASFLVFIYEINSLRLRRKLKIVIGLVDFLRLLRARLADYHDTW